MGNSTTVSILSVNGPLTEKRLRWISSIGGSLDSVNFFVALRNCLHFGQCQASAFSKTSSRTNESKQEDKEALAPLFETGMGRERYMKEL